jgi:CheY-like chemotaxis protein
MALATAARLEFRNDNGCGVWLAREPRHSGRSCRPARNTMAQHRILVVDDERDGAESLAVLLRVDGYNAETAYDGVEAVRIAATCQPHLVILDISMPEIDGFDVADKLRAQRWARDLRIVAVTGWNRTDDHERARAAGFDAYLLKPVDYGRLQAIVRSLLGQ